MKTYNINLYITENDLEVFLNTVSLKATDQKDAEKRAKHLVSFVCVAPGAPDVVPEKEKWSDTLKTVHARTTHSGPDVGLSNNSRS